MNDEKYEWKKQKYFTQKYGIDSKEFALLRRRGLPFKELPNRVYEKFIYREKDINDYFSGKIGIPDKVKEDEE